MKEEGGKEDVLPNNLPNDIGCKLKEPQLGARDSERNQTRQLHAFMGKSLFFALLYPISILSNDLSDFSVSKF